MSQLSVNKHFARLGKTAVAVISPLLFAVPFVNGKMWFFGWIGLVGLLFNIFSEKKTLKRVFCSLFCFFFLFYVFAYSWFVSLYPLDFAGLNEKESVGVILLGILLLPVIHSVVMSVFCFTGVCFSRCTENDVLKIFCFASGYTLGEYAMSFGTFAFPWARPFVGQTEVPMLLQSASLFGSYFITFLLVAVNGFVTFSIINRRIRKKCLLFALVAMGIFVVNLVFGAVRMSVMTTDNNEKMTAVILQGNIPSGEKWSLSSYETLGVYTELADKASKELEEKGMDADIVVIPETAFISVFDSEINVVEDSNSYLENGVYKISKKLDATVFTGAFGADDKENNYNSIFPFEPNGNIGKPYHKHNLVPFGEFLPYRKLITKFIPFIGKINMLSSDLTAGTEFEPLETEGGKAACLVCFDSIFSKTARKQVKNGAEFIVVSTNDSWYKTSVALRQHANHAVMRAIENARPVIRSANTGISTVVSPCGIEIGKIDAVKRDCLVAEVDMSNRMTLYTLVGDVFVLLCFAYLVLIYACYGIRKRRTPN